MSKNRTVLTDENTSLEGVKRRLNEEEEEEEEALRLQEGCV